MTNEADTPIYLKVFPWLNEAYKSDLNPTLPHDFYAEWVLFSDEEELDKAMQYLELWKHFMLKKTKRTLSAEQRLYRPAWGQELPTLSIKLAFVQEGLSSNSPNNIDNA